MSDTIYKNVGIVVCITFLIYVLISVVRIQFDVGRRVATFGSGIIKEGMTSEKSKKCKTKVDAEKFDKELKDLIDDSREATIKNYKFSGMTKLVGKENMLDNEITELVKDLIDAKKDEFASKTIKDFICNNGDIDSSKVLEDAFTYYVYENMHNRAGNGVPDDNKK